MFVSFMLICCSLLPGATLSEIIDGAKEASPTYRNILLSYENSLISLRKMEDEDKIGIAASVTADPLYMDRKGILISNDVDVYLPDDGDTHISGKLSMSRIYDGDTALSVTLGASHTFDFRGYSSTNADDISYTYSKYNMELTKKTSELNFEKSVINTISTILSFEESIASFTLSLEKQKALIEKMDALGTYSNQSPSYVSALNTLSQFQSSLESVEKQYANAKESFLTLTGKEWTGLDEIPEPSMEIKTYENGNTSVLLKSLNAQAKEEAYRKEISTSTPSSLSLGGKVSGDVVSRDSVVISGSASYRGNNFSVSAAPGVSVTSSSVTPTLTISGSWNNGGKNTASVNGASAFTSTSSGSDSVQTALNNMLAAQNDYTAALSSYYEEAQSLALRVLDWESKKAKTLSDLEYAEMLLENEKTLLGLGLSTSSSLKERESEVSKARIGMNKVMLEGQALQRDLEIFAL